jgi:hypothetical protein
MASQNPNPTTAPQTFAQIFNPERTAGAKKEETASAPGAAPAPAVPKPVDPIAAKLAPRTMKAVPAVPAAGATRPPLPMTLPGLGSGGPAAPAGVAGAAGTAPGLPVGGTAPAVTGGTKRPAPDGATSDTPISEGVMRQSNSTVWMRASGAVLKWGVYGGLALAGCFAAGKYVVFPVISELQAAKKGGPVVVDKKATPTAQALQQTRQVIATNNAKVDYLNAIIEDQPVPDAANAKKSAPAKVEPKEEAKPVAPKVLSGALPEQRREAVAGYQITGALHAPGEEARILLDGRLVKFGEIVDSKLGLRFMGLDPTQEFAVFTTGTNEVLRKRVEANREPLPTKQ